MPQGSVLLIENLLDPGVDPLPFSEQFVEFAPGRKTLSQRDLRQLRGSRNK